MIALDFVTRQDDRHLSNIAVKVTDSGESFYPLYDNGRSLFYEDTPKTVERTSNDPISYCTSFGPAGTYYDAIVEIKETGVDFSRILNLDIKKSDIKKVLKEAGFSGYRLDGSLLWIENALKLLKD